jgi:inorganic phosphate transporter, PiT family
MILSLAVASALAFAFSTGLLDAPLATATIVSTRAARPGQAMLLVAVAAIVGPVVAGTGVALTVSHTVTISGLPAIPVIGAGTMAAAIWNITTWRLRFPSSASHALVGGLAGAALLAGGTSAVAWGPIQNGQLAGVWGFALGLLLSPLAGVATGLLVERGVLAVLRRAWSRWGKRTRQGEWLTTAVLAGTIGANDGQKTAGVLAALLIAAGSAPADVDGSLGITLAAAAALVVGMLLSGWGSSHTLGRRLFRLHSIDALVTQGSASGVLLAATLAGAPVSPSQVYSTSIVGAGLARGRRRHVGWAILRRIVVAWIVTIPATGLLAGLFLIAWRWLAGA